MLTHKKKLELNPWFCIEELLKNYNESTQGKANEL